ncbi:MAG: Cna B-type domain-containing protein [Christensenellales bacterium]
MKNSWNKVVALMLAAALCVSCGVTGFAEDTQTDENTEVVEMVEQQNQEEPPKEEAPAPVQEPEPAPVQEEPKEEPAPAPEPVKEPEPAPVPEAPKAEEPKAEEPKKEEETKDDEKTEEKIEEKAEAPEQKIEEPAEQKTEDIKADETKKEEETKAEEPKAEEPKAEEKKTEDVKPEEKPVEQPTVPVTKVEQPAEEAPAADEVKKENITVCIEWEDEDNALGMRPTTLAVTLSGSDGQTYSAKIAEKDGWQHTFADLTTRRGAEVIYYSVDADDVTDYDKDVRGLTVTYTCTARPVVDEQPAADDENLIDDQMDGEQGELPEDGLPTITETEDGTVIDMGETAEAPVEGEDANAEKPEEDGELDEDFTLPEEGELPEEDAEPEIPEIPEIDFSTLQVVIGEPQYDGDVMTLRATLIGFDNIDYALQWQFSTDDATWTDVSGATGDTLVVQLDESNAGCYWRVSAEVFGWKTLPTEQAAQE